MKLRELLALQLSLPCENQKHSLDLGLPNYEEHIPVVYLSYLA